MIGIRQRIQRFGRFGRFGLILLCAWIVTAIPTAAAIGGLGQDTATIASIRTTSAVDVVFPEGIAVSADLDWEGVDESLDLEFLYSVGGNPTSTLIFVPFDPAPNDGPTSVQVAVDLQAQGVPSGVTLEFRWRFVDDGYVVAESDPEQTVWYDNRWDWKEISSEQVRVHYYDLESGFAEDILESAQGTVTDLEQRFELGRSKPLDVWVYPSVDDFRGAQQPNTRESIAGASYPGFYLIVAVIADGNDKEIGRVIPHEVSHQVLFQATENPFTSPPLWFDEGMATHFQIGGTDGYLEMAIDASRNGELFDLDSLEVSFPYLPAQATMAYAASWSAVQYIQDTYGDDGIARLIAAFASGVSYDVAYMEALGITGDQLSVDWAAWIAAQAG